MKVADMSDFQEPLDWSKIGMSSKPGLTPISPVLGGVVAKAERVDWADFATGSSGNIEIERGWLRVVQELFELFCKKQHDYGATNIAVGGLDGVAIRVSDKVSRLWKLRGLGAYRGSGGTSPSTGDESLRDTLLDLADYGIIATLVHDGVWKTMTLEEAWNDNKAD